LFSPETAYLDTAGYGLPPQPAFDAFQAAVDEWRHGRTGWKGWQESVDVARAAFARLHGVAAERVAVGSQVSAFMALVALSLPSGARVVAAEEDFTSVLFPLLAQEGRGVHVDLVPLDEIPSAIDEHTALVAVSAVQSADGRFADLDAIEASGVPAFVDATQACGWLPLDASRFDFVACGTYKWLLGPRGCAFLTIREAAAERLTPHLAGWFAGESQAEYYGGPLRLARDARRFDISPVWFSWVAQAASLDVLERVGIAAIHDHDVALANRFRAGLGLEPGSSAIVSIPPPPGAADRLRAAGVLFAGYDLLRFSFHLYTSEADVDRALEALGGTSTAAG
jgi:selenocysteine lyase/cysteine desulfurase